MILPEKNKDFRFNIERNIKSFILITILSLAIYTILHYIHNDLDLYFPAYIIAIVGLLTGYIYYKKTENYVNTLIIFFFSTSILVYIVFLVGGVGNVGFVWSIIIIVLAYFLLPIKYANRFTFFYTTLIVFTVLLYLKGIINLPYEKAALITIILSIIITTYVANTIIHETVENLNALAKLANFDTLTLVYNRRKILSILNEEIERARRYKRPLSILMIDIDNFKYLNDNFGHQFGDKVLKDFAKLLKKLTRKTDFIGRTGGEEFLVILPETDIEGAKRVAEKIRQTVEKYFNGIYNINITASIGITQFRETIKDIDTILNEADMAMYKAKKTGKNKVEIHKEEREGNSSLFSLS